MYGGHIALGISAKRWVPIVPLWLLVIASQLPDWVDVIVCTIRPGTARPAMLSHSIPAIALFAAVSALGGRFFFGSWYVAKVLALLALSHIVGDYVTGVKPTWPGGPVVGLRLYANPLIDFAFESAVIAWGWWMYRSTFRPVNRDTYAVRGMLLGLIALQAVADIAFMVVPRITKCG
ncbi:MAG: metal-dependent hydrolase [Gemmatimonadaceae bacterium]|nr:metal-dependent hydrolase [Gemmatimonadaceae bacterium]